MPMSPASVVPRPLCFLAMPFGKKSAPGGGGPVLDFDAVYAGMAPAIEKVGLDCRRADFDPSGGFIHRSMFEALLVAEYVVVDLTFANANVAYEVGLRHGANAGRGTILVCEQGSLATLPFDFRPLRTIPYQAGDLGALGAALAERLTLAVKGELPADNPILQITSIRPTASGHEKTDIFAQRMSFASAAGERVAAILRLADAAKAVSELQALETELLGAAGQITQLHTALLAIYLGYRAKTAWPEMVALYGKMPPELQASPVAREQLALAHNRVAEGLAGGDAGAADEERRAALHALDAIPRQTWTSETYAILGRIHKAHADAEEKAGRPAAARAALSAAIKAYEDGFRSDPRDFFPGINAVTLRIVRNGAGDEAALAALMPVVRFSLDRAPAPNNADEAYYQAATRLELSAAARDWPGAREALEQALAADVARWMHETTVDNLRRQARARAAEPDTVRELEALAQALSL
jgi:hypothetical protein